MGRVFPDFRYHSDIYTTLFMNITISLSFKKREGTKNDVLINRLLRTFAIQELKIRCCLWEITLLEGP